MSMLRSDPTWSASSTLMGWPPASDQQQHAERI